MAPADWLMRRFLVDVVRDMGLGKGECARVPGARSKPFPNPEPRGIRAYRGLESFRNGDLLCDIEKNVTQNRA